MLHRRSVLAAPALALVWPRAASAAQTLRLWPGPPPGGGGPIGPVAIDARGAIYDIAVPTLEVFEPVRPNGAAMLVAGGGGYKRIEMETEARPAARWLAARGITAFVLAYRLPTEGWNAGPLAPLQDAQRAIRSIRLQMPGARLGVLGFSAGGHLMGMAAGGVSDQPDAAALIYPVITLEPPYDHTSTRRSLIGPHPTPASAAAWSVQNYVRPGAPAIFLVQADDDPISDPANSAIMAEACRRAGVPVEVHRLSSGGHGFGMGRPGTPSAAWPGWFKAWLQQQRLL